MGRMANNMASRWLKRRYQPEAIVGFGSEACRIPGSRFTDFRTSADMGKVLF
jgi:hypothetical protein